MNCQNIYSHLCNASSRYFCSISRYGIPEDLTAMPILCNKDILLLAEYDESYSFIGYSIIWVKDISNYTIFDSKSFFPYRVQKKLNITPPKINNEKNNFSSDNIFYELQHKYPLIIILKHSSHERIAWVGKIIKITAQMILLEELDANANWTGTHYHKISSISKVTFGDSYSSALWLVAEENWRGK